MSDPKEYETHPEPNPLKEPIVEIKADEDGEGDDEEQQEEEQDNWEAYSNIIL